MDKVPSPPRYLRGSPVKRKRGGKRPNSGRKKTATPIKKSLYESKKRRQIVTRNTIRNKYDKILRTLSALRENGRAHTERYRTLFANSQMLANWLNLKSRRKGLDSAGEDAELPAESFEGIAAILQEHGSDSSDTDEV